MGKKKKKNASTVNSIRISQSDLLPIHRLSVRKKKKGGDSYFRKQCILVMGNRFDSPAVDISMIRWSITEIGSIQNTSPSGANLLDY